jgi:hypothetical protein
VEKQGNRFVREPPSPPLQVRQVSFEPREVQNENLGSQKRQKKKKSVTILERYNWKAPYDNLRER